LAVFGEGMRYIKGKRYAEKDIAEEECFNKNMSVAVWCLKVRDKYSIKTAVETGTYLSRTTAFLVEAFNKVYTVDVFDEFVKKAREKFKGRNVECICGKSTDMLGSICEKIDKDEMTLFFLDAHGNYISDLIKLGWREDRGESKAYYTEEFDPDLCPAKQEIEIIAKYFQDRCIIIVDDIYNPEHESGHINFGGVRFGHDYLKDSIEKCYTGPYKHKYICGDGLSRGWFKSVLLVEPK
jgi:hypothetical protein